MIKEIVYQILIGLSIILIIVNVAIMLCLRRIDMKKKLSELDFEFSILSESHYCPSCKTDVSVTLDDGYKHVSIDDNAYCTTICIQQAYCIICDSCIKIPQLEEKIRNEVEIAQAKLQKIKNKKKSSI
jgi:hypothetical protein